ncbi:Serine/threonine protein kinase [Thermomonospora echinospora]|uniref:non-specific serine/threonine protein kinase n=1 Tax=Thermomonospora echinospora TaxID=1992 RepID=A0A1H6CJH9_9ACTN|nr:serine/threonine-protein kinase [Thermomonospora echinospora]SEG73082.1 Serine/threonine protein kinase [Thermomonospora echinospora]
MRSGVLIAARYRLDRRIGDGGAAEVWRATDELMARPVAVKVVRPELVDGREFRRRFQNEARSAAGLVHPRVAAVHDHGEAGGIDGRPVPYLVMELLDGRTLADRLTDGPLGADEAVRIGGQIAEALAAAHAAGVVHGDVRPANVFLCGDGVKVLDFGIALAFRGPAPDRPDDAAADVHALGVTLTEMLTGERALEGNWPADVPADVAALCSRCRADDPRERPTAAKAHAALTGSPSLVREDVVIALPIPPHRRGRFSGGPARMLGIATAVGLAAATVLTAVILPETDPAGRRSAPPFSPLPGPSITPQTEPPSFASPSFASPSLAPPSSAVRSASPSPPPTKVVTPPRRAPSRRTLVIRLSRVREVIEAGRVHGELHPEVAAELDRLVTDFQNELAAHRPVEVDQRLDLLRTKVAERYRSGAVTRGRAVELLTAIDAVDSPVHAAPAFATPR